MLFLAHSAHEFIIYLRWNRELCQLMAVPLLKKTHGCTWLILLNPCVKQPEFQNEVLSVQQKWGAVCSEKIWLLTNLEYKLLTFLSYICAVWWREDLTFAVLEKHLLERIFYRLKKPFACFWKPFTVSDNHLDLKITIYSLKEPFACSREPFIAVCVLLLLHFFVWDGGSLEGVATGDEVSTSSDT